MARNPEIGNTPVWILPNIWRLGRVMDTKFGTNGTNKMLLNAAKFQGYSFYCFWVIKGKPTVRVKLPSQLSLYAFYEKCKSLAQITPGKFCSNLPIFCRVTSFYDLIKLQSEAYLEPSRTSTMELFAKIVNG